MSWFQNGHRNTKFFHVQVNGRRKRLQLKRIQYSARNRLEDTTSIADEAVKFFEAQFKEDIVPTVFGILEHVPHMIQDGQNHDLVKQPSREEVK